MILGVDTNVLIYAHLPWEPAHELVRRYLTDKLADPDVTLAVTPTILHEFVHVITDPRRFDPPVTMSEALAIARLYVNRSNVVCLAIDEQVVSDAFRLLERHGFGRKRIADTLLVATWQCNGVRDFLTCDTRHFAAFEDLNVIDPREA